ncbi:unnamed protein product [Closterium sp. NIES-65]|nr:unnamed protein product [Closterium sp. NIES-65]
MGIRPCGLHALCMWSGGGWQQKVAKGGENLEVETRGEEAEGGDRQGGSVSTSGSVCAIGGCLKDRLCAGRIDRQRRIISAPRSPVAAGRGAHPGQRSTPGAEEHTRGRGAHPGQRNHM